MNIKKGYTGVIYKYTFPNGKVYIGQTRRNPTIRHREHLDSKTGPLNSAFWRAYTEQGEPKYEIIESYQFESIEQLIAKLNQQETYYITLYNATNPEFGYNIKATGTVTSNRRQKLEKIKQLYFMDYKQNILPIFQSVEKKLDNIEQMTDDEKNLYQKYFIENIYYKNHNEDEVLYEEWCDFARFCFEEDIITIIEEFVNENEATLLDEYYDSETIYQISKTGEIVAKYASQIDAATAIGVKTSANINNVVRGKQKSAYGYKWVRAIDYEKEHYDCKFTTASGGKQYNVD